MLLAFADTVGANGKLSRDRASVHFDVRHHGLELSHRWFVLSRVQAFTELGGLNAALSPSVMRYEPTLRRLSYSPAQRD